MFLDDFFLPLALVIGGSELPGCFLSEKIFQELGFLDTAFSDKTLWFRFSPHHRPRCQLQFASW